MTLFKKNRRYYRAILTGTLYIKILQSNTLMAASSEVEAGGDATSKVSSSSSETVSAAAGSIVPIPPAVPTIAVGHEALYQRFMAGRLEYRPDPNSDAGLIILPFWDLLAPLAGTANPLSATLDLSKCGDAGNYLSINLGYKKAKIPANARKTEIWICPKFLAERELGTMASSLEPIMGEWEAPMGYFWTWGSDAVRSDNYDYLLQDIVMDNDKSLYDKWPFPTSPTHHRPMALRKFSCHMMGS
jgi:hypothetical protein